MIRPGSLPPPPPPFTRPARHHWPTVAGGNCCFGSVFQGASRSSSSSVANVIGTQYNKRRRGTGQVVFFQLRCTTVEAYYLQGRLKEGGPPRRQTRDNQFMTGLENIITIKKKSPHLFRLFFVWCYVSPINDGRGYIGHCIRKWFIFFFRLRSALFYCGKCFIKLFEGPWCSPPGVGLCPGDGADACPVHPSVFFFLIWKKTQKMTLGHCVHTHTYSSPGTTGRAVIYLWKPSAVCAVKRTSGFPFFQGVRKKLLDQKWSLNRIRKSGYNNGHVSMGASIERLSRFYTRSRTRQVWQRSPSISLAHPHLVVVYQDSANFFNWKSRPKISKLPPPKFR